MHRAHFVVFICLIVLTKVALSTDFWTPQQRSQFESQKKLMRINILFQGDLKSDLIKGNLPRHSLYPYPAEFLQIADFLSHWQVLNPAATSYGGMIEAESGSLGSVIQTDNTQEAIVVWCQYAELTGDTLTYGSNIDAAWTYIMNFPAYDEEGDPGDDYYRNHNCAWAAWGEQWYERVYGDTTYRWYADSCANYMATHQIQVFQPESNLNAFVMGWMAGNLYQYGKYRNNPAWVDSALVIGNKVLAWANANPAVNLADFTWAMSSGTAVWGMFNSVFKEDSTAGINWLQNNAQYLPVYFDNYNFGETVWDSAWNVALVNAYRSMHIHSSDSTYNLTQSILTDTLLSLDTDDDGGIMSNKNHPPTMDMSWISAYLDVMGVDYNIQQSADFDGGVVKIFKPDTGSLYLIGDTLSVDVKTANFGKQTLQNLLLSIGVNGSDIADTTIDLAYGEIRRQIFEKVYPVEQAGSLTVSASVQVAGDPNSYNDQKTETIYVPPFVAVQGEVKDAQTGNGVAANITFNLPENSFSTSTDPATGSFQIALIPGIYMVHGETAFPYPQFDFDSVSITTQAPPAFLWETLPADLAVIDDDEGADYELYLKDGLEKMISDSSTSPVKSFYYWNAQEQGVFPPSRLHELASPYVIWFTGDADTTALTPAERDSLQTLLNFGANILLTGKDIAEGTTDSLFLEQVLHVHYAGNSTWIPRFVYGVSGDPISNALKFNTWGGFGANNQVIDRDIIEALPPAQTIFYYLPQDSQSAGIRLRDNNYKLVYLGFGMEGIRDDFPNYNTRANLFRAVFNWFRGVIYINDDLSAAQPVEKFHLFPLYPNPFNSTAHIRFTLDKPQFIKLEVYDILGRKIRELSSGNVEAGKHEFTWPGRNQSGKTVGSGVYYIRLRGENEQQIRKILLLK